MTRLFSCDATYKILLDKNCAKLLLSSRLTWCKIQAKAQVGNIRVDLDWDGWDWIDGDFGEIVHYTLRFVFKWN